MTTATATNLDGSEPDEVMVAEELAAAAKLDAEFDGTEAAAAAVDEHNTIATDTAPTIDVVRAGIRSLLIAWDGVEAVHGHGYYEAQIDTVSNFASPDDFYKGKSTFTVFDGLTTGVVYYARVRAVDAAGNTGPWSTSTGAQTSDETGTGDIADDAVTTVKIDDLAVTTAKIDSLAVTNAKIANLAVTTAKIADADITTAKIANLAVTEAKIDDLAVDTAKIKNLAVETLKIADLNVTIDKEASPVGVDGAGGTSTGFGVTTTETTVHSHTINVPAWAGNAGLMTIAHLSADNSTATGGFLLCRAIIAGGPGGENSSRLVGAGEWGGTVTASAQREISSPGSTISCGTVASHSGSGTWSSGSNNADADTLATFTR